MRKATLAACVLVVLLLGANPARADVIVRGYVVRLSGSTIYCDIGQGSGLIVGQALRTKRPYQVRHPVTGKMVADEVLLDVYVVTAVGETLSVAAPAAALLYPAQPGDIVEVLIPRDEPEPEPTPLPPPPPPPSAPPPEAPALDESSAQALRAFTEASGRSLEVRITTWEAFLEEFPGSTFAPGIRADLASLRATQEKFRAPSETMLATEPTVGGILHASPGRWRPGQKLGLAFLVEVPQSVAAAWLHYRKLGSETYRKTELVPSGDGYLRGAVAADEVDAPGLEYFVEIVGQDGGVGSAHGTPKHPVVVSVEDTEVDRIFVQRRNRSRVSLSSSYQDFATFDGRGGAPRDNLFQFEVDFFYRLRTFLYGMRVGMGVLNGEGGSINPRVGETEPEKVGFNYGYTELEFRGSDALALLVRGIAGLGKDGMGFGAEGRLRLGSEERTNLTFGASTLQDIGFVSELKLTWDVFKRIPLAFAVAVSDQPAQGELGVRFSTDVGVRILDWMRPTLQLSYQGRNVTHSGMGAGLGLVFDW
jgi:hypothetical protein